MDNVQVQIIAVLALGVVVFAAARFSRESHESGYGVSSAKERLRFAAVFLSVLIGMVGAVVFYPMVAMLVIGVILVGFWFGLLGIKSGLYKDFTYAATICAFISLFAGVLVHGM